MSLSALLFACPKLAWIITDDPWLLYGLPALLALLLVIVVVRLIVTRRRKTAAAPAAPEMPIVCDEPTPAPQPNSEPASVAACEEPAPVPEAMPTPEPVALPDIVGGEHAVVDLCPTEVYECDGKLQLTFDVQVRVD